jgi:uncharacterized damage-inducible protein DinB
MDKKEFLETWQIHNNINLYLLNSINEENLADISSSKGRNVGEQFAHIHNVRLMWLQSASPELFKDQKKIEKDSRITKKILTDELSKSARAVTSLLDTGFETGRIKGFKPHAAAFLGYLISHESHHRGQIILSLKQSGHPVDKKIAFGIWEWGTKLS